MIYLLNPYKEIQHARNEDAISEFLLGPDNSGNIVYLDIVEQLFGAKAVHPSILYSHGADALPSGAVLLLPWSNMICEEYSDRLIDILISNNIDVVPVSVGIQAPFEKSPFSLKISDDSLKLLKYASERGRTPGVRGHITQCILRSHGIETIVIGCPSCYDIPFDQIEYNLENAKLKGRDDIRYAANNTISGHHRSETASLMKWIVENASTYVLQSEGRIIADVYKARLGKEMFNPDRCQSSLYRDDMKNLVFDYGYYNHNPDDWGQYREFFRQKSHIFFDIKCWENHIKTSADVMIGSRFHGNTMALLSGVPAIYVPFDWRTLELCLFHGLPMLHTTSYQDMHAQVRSLESPQMLYMRKKRDNAVACFKSFLAANSLDAAI